jgi:hypothetical protein
LFTPARGDGLVFIGVGFRDKATAAFSVSRHRSQRREGSGLSGMVSPRHPIPYEHEAFALEIRERVMGV